LAEKQYCQVVQEFLQLVRATKLKPTYIEVLLAMAFWEFARRRLEYVVVETEVGGLLDITNVVYGHNKTCIITDIGFDHQKQLGDMLSEIASHKAGIIQLQNPVFCYQQSDEVMQPVISRARQKQADLHTFSRPGRVAITKALPRYQQRNFYLALQAVNFMLESNEGLALEPSQIKQAAKTYIPGRMETFELGGKRVILDGAHNAQKMQALSASIKALYGSEPVVAMMSMVSAPDSRLEGALAEVSRLAGHIVITAFGGANKSYSEDPDILAARAKTQGNSDVKVITDPDKALAYLLARPEKVLVVTGSFYGLDFIRKYLLRRL
jgi:dihydrofolate synthase/folylpolyglutamate synthase